MADTNLVESLQVDITAVDQTESATKSAGDRLDAVAEKGVALSDVMSGVGKASKTATDTLAEGADAAAGSFEKLGTQAVSRLKTLTKTLTDLSAQRDSLRADLQKATDEGLDTSEIKTNLNQVENWIGRVGEKLQTVQTNLQAAATGQKAWNGQLGEENALLNGICEAENSRAQALGKTAQGYDQLTTSAKRAAEAGQAALDGMTAPDVHADVSGTVDIQAPDLSETLQEQDKLRESLNDIKSDAGLVAGELSDIGNVSQEINAGLQVGLDKSATSFLRTGRAASQLAKVMLQLMSAQDRYDDVVAQAAAVPDDKLDPQVKQSVVQDAKDKVEALQAQRDALLEAAKAQSDLDDAQQKSTKSGKLEAYQITEIMDDAHKFLDMVLAGGNPLQALFYEAPNALAIAGGNGGYGAGLSMLKNVLTGPAGIAVAAGAAGMAFYKMGAYAEEEESKLAKLSQQLRATRSDANNMADSITSAADSLEKMPGWDKTTARQAATTIGSTYNFTGGTSDIEALAKVAQDAGAVFGSLEDGLKAVQTAMVDPTAEIQALYQQHLPGVDAQLVEQVKELQAAGEQGKAYALVMQHLTSSTKDAAEQGLTPFQQAVEKLRKQTSPLVDAIQDLALAMGTKLLNSITSLLSLPIPAEKTTGGLAGTKVLQNPAHPEMVGMMQVNTAFTPKYDVSTAKGNVDEGITRFQNFLHQTGGNLDNALALYGGFKVGSAGGRQYAASVYGQDLSKLPSDSDALIKQESGRFNLTDGIANLVRKIALQESGGYQYDQRVSKPTSVAPVDHATSAAVIDDRASITGGAADAAGGFSTSSYTQSRAEISAYIDAQQKLLTTQAAGSKAWQETSERITQARIQLANTLSPQEQITQGMKDQNAGLSAQSGYWRSMAEVVAQFGTEARGTGVDQAALSEAIAAKQQQLATAYNDGTVAVQRQAQAQAAMLSVAGSSEQAIQHATNYQQAYNEALEDFDPKSQAFAEAVKTRTAALNSETDAQARFEQAQQNSGLQDNLSMIQAQTASIGQNADERSVMLARMQAEIQEHRKFGTVLPQEAQDYVDLSTKIAEASTEYEHQQQVMDDFTGSISDMADQLSDGVVQGFMQGTSSGMSFKNMLQGVDASVASVIARFALINPLMNALDGKTRTTLADIGNLFSETGSEGSTESSSSGAEDPLSAVAQSGWGVSPWEALNMKNQASSPSSGSAVNAGSVSAAPSALDNLFSGKAADGSGIFSSFGSAVSSIGSYMGMAGAAFGIGDMAYNLLSQLFAKRKKDYQYVSVGSDGMLDISGYVYKHIHGNDNVASGLQSDLDNINNVFGYTGVSATNTDTIGKVGWSKKGKKSHTYSLTDLLPDLDLTSSDTTMQQELKQLMPSSFDSVDTFTQDLESLKSLADELDSMKVSVSKFDDSSHVTVDHFTGYTGDMAKALSTLDGGTYSVDDLQSKFEAIEEFVGTTMPGLLDVTASGSESLMQQVDDLKQKYQDAANTAASYGLDAQALLDKGNAIAAAMIANEQTTLSQSDQSVQARYLSATGDQEGADLLNQQVSAAQEIQQLQENWRGFLGDNYADNVTYQQQLADLEKTQAAERLQIQTEYQEKALEKQKEYQDQASEQVSSVFSNLLSYAKGLDTSDASPLSVEDQYKSANDNLHTDYQAAMGGNSTALASLQTDMQTYLSLSQKYNGGGAAYVEDYQAVLTMLKSLGSMNTDALTADAMRDIMQDSTTTLASILQQILQATNNLFAETRFQNLKAAA
ncbi:phage-related minor tail protein [Acetobacter pasteurianus subsp. pasteurianus LMG 1262 = NBRC 106471]|uniref:apolipoprotein A1/A4/E domain-containing protein n=1 Tax=Acetobacter pasteurianus TaxID=438 RepID=UPI0002457185|nr:apolipoprotein A1/A4/E domain-containing protein [Acetobacter pasteurianus]GAB29853.1 phage-related minor tail protein [Acetobacter pasteurianus subsp. pasteurianus LMG 1262 = NBRC 106471]